jgi:CRISPR-associated protein Csm1
MTDTEVKLVIGALLHDVGKVIYRQGDDRRKHSKSGYDFLKEEAGIDDPKILDAVLYHHADMLKYAKIKKDSPAYIVYIADNIASAADRRHNDSEDIGFETSMPLQSVFNILNGNSQEMYYEPKTLDTSDGINYPRPEKVRFDEAFYGKVKHNIQENLRGLECSQEYVNSLLEVMEANLSFVPSSTAKNEMADISLYDHVKLTAAIASCIYDYAQEKEIHDFEAHFFQGAQAFYQEDAFLLFSMDISGIQDFIYTIASENALKTLRARSFYLEIMMEHIIDCLLEKLQLSRANLIYSGGGHCYLLLPNTSGCKNIVESYMSNLNQWLMKTFQISLYVAHGYVACSSNSLKNVPDGSYSEIFKNVGSMISAKKSHRYSAADIIRMNSEPYADFTRECKVCKRISEVDENGECEICSAIENFSKNILQARFFTVTLKKSEGALPLPGDYYLVADNKASLKTKMQEDAYFVRAYGKNEMYTGRHISTKLWVGDYTTGKTAKSFAAESEGIDRIGILRADVDNLGHAFVSGFENRENHNRYVTLSRTATLSRQLSLFFKFYIRKILEQPDYKINDRSLIERNATICYSGGDDLFIIGSWNEVIELAVDIRRKFETYTQGTLTLSAGIGIYTPGYPIHASAGEVAGLEDDAKKMPGKNAVTVFPDGKDHLIRDESGKEKKINDATYLWKQFEDQVIGEKYVELARFFDQTDERGKNFMYHLLELIRSREDKIYFARYVYILSRLEPAEDATQEQKANYKTFSEKMYRWYLREEDCRQLRTAMTLYAYLTREKEKTADENQ